MPTSTLKSLEKAIDLLLVFSPEKPVHSLAEISTALEIPESSAYRLIATFQKKGLIVRDPRTGKYALGPWFLRLHATVAGYLDVATIAFPHLEELQRQSGETAYLYLLQGENVVCVEAVTSPNTIRFMPDKGKVMPLHAPAGGRAVLAFQADSFIKAYLEQTKLEALTPFTVTDPDTLQVVLSKIRSDGFAITSNQAHLGGRGLAAPIFDCRQQAIGSLGVSGPDSRFSEAKAQQFAPVLIEHAASVSQALGALPSDRW